MKIYQIDSSARKKGSTSSALANRLLDKIKKGVSNIDKKIRNKFIQMWNWIKEKVNMAFEWIKKQGEKMLGMLMRFFGIEVTDSGLRGRGPELFTQ